MLWAPGGRIASVKWTSGLKKCVSLSEEFLVPISIIEPYNILYNFIFISYPICSVLCSFPALPANPSSYKPTNAFFELSTSMMQKSSLPFKPVEQYSKAPSSSNSWFNLLNTRIIPSVVFWNRLTRSILIIQILPVAQVACPGLCGCCSQVPVALISLPGHSFDV